MPDEIADARALIERGEEEQQRTKPKLNATSTRSKPSRQFGRGTVDPDIREALLNLVKQGKVVGRHERHGRLFLQTAERN